MHDPNIAQEYNKNTTKYNIDDRTNLKFASPPNTF